MERYWLIQYKLLFVGSTPKPSTKILSDKANKLEN